MKNYFKINRFAIKCKNNSGIILLVVLWVLIILTILTISLGRHTRMELSMVRFELGKVKAKYLAWAGLMYSIEQIHADTADKESAKMDTIYKCGVPITDLISAEEKFKEKPLGDGYFDIQYERNADSDESEYLYGFQDEERFININGLTPQNINIVETLFEILGIDSGLGKTITSSIIDWKDADNAVTNDPYGSEDDYYMSLDKPYHIKNLAFDTKEELYLVRGMSKDIYDKIKSHITIYPKDNTLKINFDTASETILRAMTRSVSGPQTNTDVSDADSLVEKILDYRDGDDGVINSEDDNQIEINKMALNSKEKVLFMAMNKYRTMKSEYFRVQITGVEDSKNIKSSVEAVIKRSDLEIVSWSRQ